MAIQNKISALYVPGETFKLQKFSDFYTDDRFGRDILEYISSWVDPSGTTYEDEQEVSFTQTSVDLSACWCPINRTFEVQLSNCIAVLSCIPNKLKYSHFGTITDLANTGISGTIYQDSMLVLSVQPDVGHNFLSAGIYGNDVGVRHYTGSPFTRYNKTCVPFVGIDGEVNMCSVMLSASINASDLNLARGTTAVWDPHSVMQLSVICRSDGMLNYWRGDSQNT